MSSSSLGDNRTFHDFTETQIRVVTAILAIEMVLYIAVLGFIIFNFWRIMVMQRKFTLIPLCIFYVSSPTICLARFCDCLYFILYYHTDPEEGLEFYDTANKATVVATYFNIMMGIF